MPSAGLRSTLSAPSLGKAEKGVRLREYQRLVKALPTAKWLLETDDFFKKKVARPAWNQQTVLFKNDGQCANARSYFDRWRDRGSDYLPKVGFLRSTWLIGNAPEGDAGAFVDIKSRAVDILMSHVHESPTPRGKYVAHSSLLPVKRWPKEIQRPDIIAGSSYGSKYNDVAHPNFREYFGKHRKHGKLEESVQEAHQALVRSSLQRMDSGKLQELVAMGAVPRMSIPLPSSRRSMVNRQSTMLARQGTTMISDPEAMALAAAGDQKYTRVGE